MNGQEEVGARRAPSTLITTFISFTAPTCKFSGTIRRLHFHSYLHTASTLFTKTAPLHQHGGIFTHLNLFSVWTQFKIQSRGFSDQCFIVSEDISAFAHGHTVRLDHQSDLWSFHGEWEGFIGVQTCWDTHSFRCVDLKDRAAHQCPLPSI